MDQKTVRTPLYLVGLVAGMLALGCGPKYPECETDDHCTSHNQVCVDKMCRDCRDAAQCNRVDPCMECTGGYVCARQQGCCKSDLDCPGGRCWKQGDAETGTCGGQCMTDEHCPAGQTCAGQQCVPDVSCTDDSACSTGERCVNGQCVQATCEIEVIGFDFNETTIRLDQEQTIAANASCLKERARPHRVEGHCDDRGSDEYNLALGQRRASAVARQYRQLGVSDALLSTISYGEERPVCTDGGEACWLTNRRVETVPQ